MAEYRLKTGKNVVDSYKKVEEKFTEKFLEKDESSETGYTLKTGKVGEAVVGAYKKIENGVVGGYKKIETGVVGGYKKIENKFVDTFLEEVSYENQNRKVD